jgi:hypothetical protein
MVMSHLKRSAVQATDFDLHGLVGIRLLNASPSDVAAVKRQLGPIETPLSREPDILIRFVDRLPSSPTMRCLGLDAWFDDDAFFVLGNGAKTNAKVQIPFEQIGQTCEIVCETGVRAIPLLIAIVNLTMLNKGVVPLHASAFIFEGVGVVVTGWAKGGKTETLLAFTERGATYLGDEWVYIGQDGKRLYGIPQPITVWDWHLKWLPRYQALVSRRDLLRMRSVQFADKLGHLMLRWSAGGTDRQSIMRKALPVLKRQLTVNLPPQLLFGEDLRELTYGFDRLFFVASHDLPSTVVEPVEIEEVVKRMVFSLQYERLPLLSQYFKFRFAFPDKSNQLIESAEVRQRELLERAFAGKQTYAVFHPYPVPIPALFEAIRPHLGRQHIPSEAGSVSGDPVRMRLA